HNPPPFPYTTLFRSGIASSHKLIIMVANMHAGAKGHGDLIEAAGTVRETCPEARFLLAGDGEMRPFFEDQVRTLGLAEIFVFLRSEEHTSELQSPYD